jgi:hypothetical protein
VHRGKFKYDLLPLNPVKMFWNFGECKTKICRQIFVYNWKRIRLLIKNLKTYILLKQIKVVICHRNISALPRFRVIGMRQSNEDMF